MSNEVTLEQVKDLARGIKGRGGRALFAGGFVRDQLLGNKSKDVDVEVHGLDPNSLKQEIEIFAKFNKLKVDEVGASFTVLKVGTSLDISLPRTEKKSGIGHKAFEIVGNPNLGTLEASRRRDFTINSLLQDVLTGEIIDHFGGREDLKNGLIRVVDPSTFVDDSLRVLRAAQFAARFSFNIGEDTINLCRSIDLSDLPKERIWTEIEKLLLGRDPRFGLGWLNKLGIVDQLFPELVTVRDKGRFFGIGLTLEAARKLIGDLPHEKKVTIMLVALCGDFRSDASVESFLDRLNIQTINNFKVRETVLTLLKLQQHFVCNFESNEEIKASIRKLSTVVEIDLFARILKARGLEQESEWLVDEASKLGVLNKAPEPVLMGRHLLMMGLKPSPQIGEILDEVFEQQIEGKITNLDEAKEFAYQIINR